MKIEASGGGVLAIAIIIIFIFMTIGGCLGFVRHTEELTKREKEKTKQIELEWKIDSLKSVNNTTNEK